jgi:hypothetical protein
MLHRIKSTINALLLASFNHFFMLGKVSFIVGSKAAFFSLTQCITPLMGRYGGTQTSIIYFLIRTLLKALVTGPLSLIVLLYHIPSLFQCLYWALIAPKSSQPAGFFAKIALSVLCMSCIGLFVTHTVGSQAYIYSFFWIFPAVMPFIVTQNLFLHALASTFVAHAVGSVIWLYTAPMTPEVWLSLIPIVVIERLLFALGIVILSKVYDGFNKHKVMFTVFFKNMIQPAFKNECT